MKRLKQLRVRLQHCVWALGFVVASGACGTAEVVQARNTAAELDAPSPATPIEDTRAPAVDNGAFVLSSGRHSKGSSGEAPASPSEPRRVRGDDNNDGVMEGPEDALSPPLSPAEEASLAAQVAADVAAINDLHVISLSGATPACDESSCVYFCDTICLDVDPRDQAARVATLRALAEDASGAAAHVDGDAASDADRAEAEADVEADLAALYGLAVVDGISFDDAADECPSCYQFTIDDMNAQRRLALHSLVAAAKIELSPLAERK